MSSDHTSKFSDSVLYSKAAACDAIKEFARQSETLAGKQSKQVGLLIAGIRL